MPVFFPLNWKHKDFVLQFMIKILDLYTFMIDHKSCNMLSKLIKLTLQNTLQQFCDKYCVFRQKSKNTHTKIKHKTFPGAGN